MNTQRFQSINFALNNSFSVAVGFLSLVAIYVWWRPYSFLIAMASLCTLAILKLVHSSLASRERSLTQSLEAGISGVTTTSVEQARFRALIAFALLNASASICGVASLLTVLHWYK